MTIDVDLLDKVSKSPEDTTTKVRQDDTWTSILKGYGDASSNVGGLSGAAVIDASKNNVFDGAVTGNITSFTVNTDKVETSVTIFLGVFGAYAVNLSSIDWGTAGLPPMTFGKNYILGMFTWDTGATWFGMWREY